jgi:cobalt/nickel transport system permease protein
LHYAVLDQWSRGSSLLHRRDARVKLAVLLIFLILAATARQAFSAVGALWLAWLAGAIVLARLPLAGALLRASVVLPFSAVFAGVTWLAGDAPRALNLLAKSYLSALAVVLLVGTTPLPQLLSGLESLGVPRFLLMVCQFLYRYLFVISEEAQRMRTAAQARGGTARRWLAQPDRFRAAAGALAVLFARSYSRAEEIHRAMLARGFTGRFRGLGVPRVSWADGVFALTACCIAVALRVLPEAWAR